jgi:hypothetical protein
MAAGMTTTNGCDDSGLSTAKPANPNDGHKFWCTDTKELLVYDNATASWKSVVVLGASGAFTLPSGAVISTSTVAGLQISGAPAQKLGFFGETPVGQPSTAGTSTGYTSVAGTAVNHTSTFTGGVGSIAYTIGDVVKHLKTVGILDS